MKQLAFLFIAALSLSACASAPQTSALLKDLSFTPRSYQIPHVPFVIQSENYCGPASLKMVADFAGKNAELSSLAAMMFTPGKKAHSRWT